MSLTGKQYQDFTKAIIDAFPSQPQLTRMVRYRLDKNLAAISLGADLEAIAFDLIGAAEAGGWTNSLLLSARESNPGNPQLLAFAAMFGLAPALPERQELERLIKTTNAFIDIAAWRQRLGEIEAQVCRVEIATPDGTVYGTGFLLAPDVVMTNYHVMQRVIEPQGVSPQNVVLRFDYKRLADGTAINPGKEYRLASEWLIDSSPPSLADQQPEPKTATPNPDELDYALLRIEDSPGLEPVGDSPEPEAPPRKWIEVSDKPVEFLAATSMFIVQHPQADPLKLALDDDGVIGLNANGTRVMYETNTEPGSSGSPCFSANWELVALHHSGDPNFDPAHRPTYNQGIPFSAIAKLLQERGHRDKLGEQQL